MEATIRMYVQSDFEKHILPLDRENVKIYHLRHYDFWDEKDISKQFYEVLRRKGIVLILEYNQEFIGHVVFEKDLNDKDAMFIHDFQIKEEFRNKGMGSDILLFIENLVKEKKYKKIKLDAFEDNFDSLRLYQRLGYKINSYSNKSKTYELEKIL